MPHLVLLYTPNLEADGAFPVLCRALADALIAVRDEGDRPVFPVGGVRVLALPATHFAVADGSAPGADGHGFVYANLRMARGRSEAARAATGAALSAVLRSHVATHLAGRRYGLTLQIDEGAEVFDAKLGNLHELFRKA